MDSGERWRLGRRPALDGLRGVAILLVLSAHTVPIPGMNAGSVGVTVFFALSGFLITSLLLQERGKTGGVSFRRFYGRRARRLLPALAAYMAFWVGFSVFTDTIGFELNPLAVLSVVFYFSNWLMALHWAMPFPTGITWSLAIEEQFYLLWPIALLAALRWRRGPETVAALGVVTAVALRLASWNGTETMAASIYRRSDTRMDSLLAGCLLALVVGRVGVAWVRPFLGWVGVAALGVMVVSSNMELHYLGEPLLAAVATCCLIAAVLTGRARVLEQPVLRWFGRRSYALYLWHYPITVLAGPGHHLYPMWVAVLLSLAAAETSWWVIERPFMRAGRSGRGVVRSYVSSAQGGVVERDLVEGSGVGL